MRLFFKKPLVPNFAQTDKGIFDIIDLSREEFDEYKELFLKTLEDNRDKRIKLAIQNNEVNIEK